jgi:hypothetical protein
MGLRGWVVCGVLVAAIGWWYSPLSPRVPRIPLVQRASIPAATPNASDADPAGALAGALCPPPPRVRDDAEPLQSPVPDAFPALTIESARLSPLAGFSIDARVLSRRDYAYGREADFSPTDLALGWGRMRDETVLARLDIEQRGRWYHYRWRDSPPIPSREIAKSSANMHIIPADLAAAGALRRVRDGQRVRIDGWLVEVAADDGWKWRSSLTRDDMGAGACELIYACTIVTGY